MTGSTILLDTLVRGVTLGALLVTALGLAVGRVGRDVRVSGVLLAVSLGAWAVTQSAALWGAFGNSYALVAVAYPLGGLFWLFVAVVFAERPVSGRTLAPAAVLVAAGLAIGLGVASPLREDLWALRNLAVAGLLLLAGWTIAPARIFRSRRDRARRRGPG